MVGDLLGEPDLVGDHDHRPALAGQVAHDTEHLADRLGVQRRGGLVEQDELRAQRERAGDPHPLLLAAGQLGRVGVRLVAQPHLVEQGQPALAGGRHRLALGVHRPLDDVLQRRAVREQVVGLEHHARARGERLLLLAGGVGGEVELDLAHAHDARLGLLEAVEAAQQGGLARARRADEHRHRPVADLEADITQHDVVAERLAQVAHQHQGHDSPPPLRPSRSGRGTSPGAAARTRAPSRSTSRSPRPACRGPGTHNSAPRSPAPGAAARSP